MLEYLNFCLICVLFSYLYARVKRYLPLLKMAEELIGNLSYETPQLATKHQKLLECILIRNSKLYLGKASGVNQYHGICAVIALGVIGGLGYFIYRTKKGEQPSNPKQNNPKPHPQAQLQSNKFEMD